MFTIRLNFKICVQFGGIIAVFIAGKDDQESNRTYPWPTSGDTSNGVRDALGAAEKRKQ